MNKAKNAHRRFNYEYQKLNNQLLQARRASDAPSWYQVSVLASKCSSGEDRAKCEAMIRSIAIGRICGRSWESWLKKPSEIGKRLFGWSNRKFELLVKE